MLLWMELVFARENHFAQPSMGEGGAKNSYALIASYLALICLVKKVLS